MRQGELVQSSGENSWTEAYLAKRLYQDFGVVRPHFDPRVWKQAQLLLTGTMLARGQRTVTAALRVMGLRDERHFQNCHRVLNRAVSSSRALSQTLLRLLTGIFVPAGPLIIGGNETIERRRAFDQRQSFSSRQG